MTATVPWQEPHADMADRAAEYLVGRGTPGGLDGNPLRVFQRIDGVKTRSADNPDRPVAHKPLLRPLACVGRSISR